MQPVYKPDPPHVVRGRHPKRNDLSRTWLWRFSLEGALGNGFIILTGGAFLTSLALYFGAGDFEIGILCAIPFLAQIAQICSSWFIEQMKSRKKLVISGFLAGRIIWLLILPLLLFSPVWRLEAFLALVIASNFAVMLATPAWLSWISDLVPVRIRGRYFGHRASAIAVSTVITTVLGGYILDWFSLRELDNFGFAVITILASIMALISVIILKKLPDPQNSSVKTHYTLKSFLEPIRDTRFRGLLSVFFIWNISIGIAAVFFAAHMLTNLKMSFTQIALYSSSVALSAIFVNRIWGKLIDRFGSKPVLAICSLGITLVPLVWLFPREDFLWILALESTYTGILWAGFNLAAFNMPIANSPQQNRPSYLAAFSVITGFGFFLASLFGGWLAETYSSLSFHIGSQTLVNYHLLFVISSILRFLSALLILKFHEPHEKSVPVMIQFIGYAALKHISLGRQILPITLRKEKVASHGGNVITNLSTNKNWME